MRVYYDENENVKVPYMGQMVDEEGVITDLDGTFSRKEWEEIFGGLTYEQALEKMGHSEAWIKALKELKEKGIVE